MNTLIKNIFGSQVRLALGVLGGLLIKSGFTTEAAWSDIATALAPIIVAAIWATVENIWRRRMQLTAQAMPGPVTELQVEQEVKKGNAPPVTLAKDEAPPLVTSDHVGDLGGPVDPPPVRGPR